MMSKENISAARPNRAFSHIVRYRTYLTPPSNPFREGKSKLQILREAILVIFVVALVMTVVVQFFQDTDATSSLPDEVLVQKTAGSSFETVQSQMQKLRGEIQQAKEKRHHDTTHRHHDEEPIHEKHFVKTRAAAAAQQDGEDANEVIVKAVSGERIVNGTPEKVAELQEEETTVDGGQSPGIKEGRDESAAAAATQDKPTEEEVELKES